MWSHVIRAGYAIGGIIAAALTGVQIDRVAHGIRPGCDHGNCLKSLLMLPYHPVPRVVRSNVPSSKILAGPDTTNITIRISDASKRGHFSDSSVFTLLATNGDSEFDFYQSSNSNFTVIMVDSFIEEHSKSGNEVAESLTNTENGTFVNAVNGSDGSVAHAAFAKRNPGSLGKLIEHSHPVLTFLMLLFDFLYRSIRGWIWIPAIFGIAWIPVFCMAFLWYQQQENDFARIDTKVAMSMVPGLYREVTLRRKVQDCESEIYSLLAMLEDFSQISEEKYQRYEMDLEDLQKAAVEKDSYLELLKIEAEEKHAKLAEKVTAHLADRKAVREAHQQRLCELQAAFGNEKQLVEESKVQINDQASVIKDLMETIEALEVAKQSEGREPQNWHSLVNDKDREISAVREELARQIGLHGDLAQNVDRLETDKRKALGSLESHQMALADTQRSLTDLKSSSKKFTDRLRQQVGVSEDRQTRVGKRCTQLEAEKDKIKLEKEELVAQNTESEGKVVQLEASEARLSKENAELEEKIANANSSVKTLQEAKDKLQEQLELPSAEVDGLRASEQATLHKNAGLTAELEATLHKKAALTTDLERLNTESQSFKEHISGLTSSNSELNDKVEELQDLRAQSREKVKKLEGDVMAVQHSKNRLEAENISLQKENEQRRSSNDLIRENTHLHETVKTQRDLIDRMEKAATKAAKRASSASLAEGKGGSSTETTSIELARPIVQLPPVKTEAPAKTISSTPRPPTLTAQPTVKSLVTTQNLLQPTPSTSPSAFKMPVSLQETKTLPTPGLQEEVQIKGKSREADPPQKIPWGLKLDQRPDLPAYTPTGPKSGRLAPSLQPASSQPSLSSEPKGSAIQSYHQGHWVEQVLTKGKNIAKGKGDTPAKYDARASFEMQQKRLAENKEADISSSTLLPLAPPTKPALAPQISNRAFSPSQSPAEKRELAAHNDAKAEFELQQQQLALRKAAQVASKASGPSPAPSLAPAAKGKGIAKYDAATSFALQQERLAARQAAQAPSQLLALVTTPAPPGTSSPSPAPAARSSAADSFARQQRLSSSPAPSLSISPSESAPVITRYPPPPGYVNPTQPISPVMPSHHGYNAQANVTAPTSPFQAFVPAQGPGSTPSPVMPRQTSTNRPRGSRSSKPALPAHLVRLQENDTIASPAESWYIERGMPIPDSFPESLRTGATRGPHAWYGNDKVMSGPKKEEGNVDEEL